MGKSLECAWNPVFQDGTKTVTVRSQIWESDQHLKNKIKTLWRCATLSVGDTLSNKQFNLFLGPRKVQTLTTYSKLIAHDQLLSTLFYIYYWVVSCFCLFQFSRAALKQKTFFLQSTVSETHQEVRGTEDPKSGATDLHLWSEDTRSQDKSEWCCLAGALTPNATRSPRRRMGFVAKAHKVGE